MRSRPLGLFLALLGALAIVPLASAAFPGPYATQGGDGVLSRDGSLRYVALRGGNRSTVVRVYRTRDNTVLRSQTVTGAYGVPVLTPQGGGGAGLFHDGSALVLQNLGLEATSRFLILRTSDLSTSDRIQLDGTFGFDALSPDASKLYLIQRSSVEDVEHYIVRAYDLRTHTLLPGRIADKTQKSWVMQGWAVSRATSADGRWAYTLYANPGGTPFVHALDTVAGVARCIGVPWPATDSNQSALYDFHLTLDGSKLAVRRRDGTVYRWIIR